MQYGINWKVTEETLIMQYLASRAYSVMYGFTKSEITFSRQAPGNGVMILVIMFKENLFSGG
jgi:hypothetical protein